MKDRKLRRQMTRYRLSNHTLSIETGRYHQHWLPKESRICPYCTHGEERESRICPYCTHGEERESRICPYCTHGEERESRICPYCTHGEVETEQHFLTSCPNYQHIRDTFYPKFETLCPDFKLLNKKTQILYLLGEKQDCILLAARYIDACHKKREESTNQ